MSALREWAAALGGEAHKAVAVSSLGKWKTATQVGIVGQGPVPTPLTLPTGWLSTVLIQNLRWNCALGEVLSSYIFCGGCQ